MSSDKFRVQQFVGCAFIKLNQQATKGLPRKNPFEDVPFQDPYEYDGTQKLDGEVDLHDWELQHRGEEIYPSSRKEFG
jgi:hypothetical protein